MNGQKTSRYTRLRPYETRNLLFFGMIFYSSQVEFRIEKLGEKITWCHLAVFWEPLLVQNQYLTKVC